MTTWRRAGNVAVVIGGANGIGLTAVSQFLRDGMSVLIADRDADALDLAMSNLSGGEKVEGFQCDVSNLSEVEALQEKAFERFGNVHCLMNNAGVGLPTGAPWENIDLWKQQIDINLWGIIHGCQAFVPQMLDRGQPGVVINTGSKQGLTNPPGGYAYNMSKAAVRAYTESLAHALRQIDDCPLTAHLLIPGFTYSNMIAQFLPEKPEGAWTCEQVIDFMLPALDRGDFYILCPDNETPREVDEKRIKWNTGDIVENRPALSRWHPDFEGAFSAFMSGQK